MNEEKLYLTATALGKRLHYHPQYIREYLIPQVFEEGVHYFRPFGRRKILFIWDVIERDMLKFSTLENNAIPLARGGVCHG